MNKKFKNLSLCFLALSLAISLVSCENETDDLTLDTSQVDSSSDEETLDASSIVDDEVIGQIEVETEVSTSLMDFITDTDAGDTGELRIDLGSSSLLTDGKLVANIKKTVSNGDGFISVFGTSASNAAAILDVRVGDSDGENFKLRNETPTDFSPPEFVNDQFYEIEITWDASSMVTLSVDGVQTTPSSFASGGDERIDTGARYIAFKFGGNADTYTDTEGLYVDNIVIYDTSSGSDVEVFTEDFESYTVGDVLSSASNSYFSSNTFQSNIVEGESSSDETTDDSVSATFAAEILNGDLETFIYKDGVLANGVEVDNDQDNADAFSLTPSGTVIDNEGNEVTSPYTWSNSDLKTAVLADSSCTDTSTTGGVTSSVNSGNWGIKLNETNRRLYQEFAVEVGVTYTINLFAKMESSNTASIYILNNAVSDESALESNSDVKYDITGDGVNTDYTEYSFEFTATTTCLLYTSPSPRDA